MQTNSIAIHPFRKLNKLVFLLAGYFILVVVGFLNQRSGDPSSLTLLYLLPVSLSAWFFGGAYGALTSAVCTMTWMVTATARGPESVHADLVFANALVMMAVYLFISLWLARLQRTITTERLMARTDFMTGAMNSRHFHDLVQMEMKRFKRYPNAFTVAFIDLDNFKMVNDHFGHQTGDEALRIVARTLLNNIRDTDSVARMGGDEFALLLPVTGSNEARTVMTHLDQHLRAAVEKRGFPITFSIGVVTFDSVPGSVQEIIRNADDQMYCVKREGKNEVRYAVYG